MTLNCSFSASGLLDHPGHILPSAFSFTFPIFVAIEISVVDRHRFAADSDPYPTFHFDADPDSCPGPTLSGNSEIF